MIIFNTSQRLGIYFVIRNLYDTPRYKDEEEDRRQLEARQKEVQDYRLFRERVEKWREDDRQERNRLKIQQIEECERLQVCKSCPEEKEVVYHLLIPFTIYCLHLLVMVTYVHCIPHDDLRAMEEYANAFTWLKRDFSKKGENSCMFHVVFGCVLRSLFRTSF